MWSHRIPAFFFTFESNKKGQLMSWMLRRACGETQQILGSIEVPNVFGWRDGKFPLVWWSRKGMCYEYRYIYNLQIWCQWPGLNATWFFHDVRPGIMIWLYTSGELLGCRRTICFAVLMNQSGLHLLALMALFSQFLCQAVPKKSPTNLVFRCPPSNPLGFFLLYRCLTHHFLHVSRTACFWKK